MLKRFLTYGLVLMLLVTITACGSSSSNDSNSDTATENQTDDVDIDALAQKVQSLNFQLYDKFQLESVSNEDKIAEANRIEQEIQPDIDLLQQRNDQDNDDGGDFNYAELQIYNAFGALRAECNEIREYVNSSDPESLEDINKYHDAVLDDIQTYKEQISE